MQDVIQFVIHHFLSITPFLGKVRKKDWKVLVLSSKICFCKVQPAFLGIKDFWNLYKLVTRHNKLVDRVCVLNTLH